MPENKCIMSDVALPFSLDLTVLMTVSFNCRSAELICTFKRNLKTELFDVVYSK